MSCLEVELKRAAGNLLGYDEAKLIAVFYRLSISVIVFVLSCTVI